MKMYLKQCCWSGLGSLWGNYRNPTLSREAELEWYKFGLQNFSDILPELMVLWYQGIINREGVGRPDAVFSHGSLEYQIL